MKILGIRMKSFVIKELKFVPEFKFFGKLIKKKSVNTIIIKRNKVRSEQLKKELLRLKNCLLEKINFKLKYKLFRNEKKNYQI